MTVNIFGTSILVALLYKPPVMQDRLIICFYEELYLEVALMQDDVKHPVVLG